ncbi:MAG TPA: hydrogenase maturation nickel metallochaperone HypA [Dissulfurispiraceae bacterium]|nr:hydrogenase maturation nickel metallochaperone HypA [Dissulfurispiraceae bacterium]
MHEVSIAQSLLDVAVENCRTNGFSTIKHVRVLIGKASGVMPEALLFAFDSLKEDTIARKADLEIVEVPLRGECRECGKSFETEERYVLSCPHCGSVEYTLSSGRELTVADLEVE